MNMIEVALAAKMANKAMSGGGSGGSGDAGNFLAIETPLHLAQLVQLTSGNDQPRVANFEGVVTPKIIAVYIAEWETFFNFNMVSRDGKMFGEAVSVEEDGVNIVQLIVYPSITVNGTAGAYAEIKIAIIPATVVDKDHPIPEE